jgi:UPF0755 protein
MKRRTLKRLRKKLLAILPSTTVFVALLVCAGSAFVIWSIFTQQKTISSWSNAEFPVTVDPKAKTIIQDELVDAYLAERHLLEGTSNLISGAFPAFNAWVSARLSSSTTEGQVAKSSQTIIIVKPGLRKEQVAKIFGDALGWNEWQRQEFLSAPGIPGLPFSEGTFFPGSYSIAYGTSPKAARAVVVDRFTKEVLSHYGTTTAEKVPLKDALILASIIQKETIGTDGMRLVSGILWNRLFRSMLLQVDATLQYAKADAGNTVSWWPKVIPADKYIYSEYNTYMYSGLPPAPIANPSVAAILAALNPVKTPCIYYFNDREGNILCSETYEEHVKRIDVHY